ncbi:MAG: cyclic nucleotide-binding domain-containing protein [Chloroflexi bacterium]|nr:cyclic nucleotide-binding domain-containing protein [Chloroflexota bacterium]
MNQELIRQQLLFAGLSEKDVDWLAQMAETITVPKGAVLMEEGTPGDAIFLVLDGEFEVTKRAGNTEIVIAIRGVGEMFGEMSVLENRPRTASVHARVDSLLFKVSKQVFEELVMTRPAATLSILRTVMNRLRNTEQMIRQNEKMASLGTLSAGLAHELNNPAAAARRSSAQLRDALAEWQSLTITLGALGLDARQNERVTALRDEMTRRVSAPPQIAPLARSDRESEMQTWLEDRAIEDAWDIAPVLVAFGWDANDLEKLRAEFSAPQFAIVARWLCVGCNIYALLAEVNMGAERISEIVKAVKSYAFLDQAPIQQVDIHEGLENTLVILRSKLKQGVTVTRAYATDLPHIEAYGSELNQVWTNILDNAIDAMQGAGEIKIKTFRKDEKCIVVEITDNGPGIPPEIQSRIFDPFFTTKAPGVGTGLGLNITYNIIQKHRGQIRIASMPGETTFHIELPIQLSA